MKILINLFSYALLSLGAGLGWYFINFMKCIDIDGHGPSFAYVFYLGFGR